MDISTSAFVAKLDEESWRVVADAVNRLEAAWQQTSNPQFEPLLPSASDPLRQVVLVELIKVDQELRWQADDPRKLEAYLIDWPELSASHEALTELLSAECLTRATLDLPGNADELQDRFPNLYSRLDLSQIESQAREEKRSRQIGGEPSSDTTLVKSTDTSKMPVRQITESSPMLTIGAQFSRYEIRSLIGEGAMGVVYRAYDTQLERDVALKVPRFDPQTDSEVRERFLREAKAMAAVRHSNVCPIYDAGVIDGRYYITMAFVDGQSLDSWMEGRTVQPHEAAGIVHKVAVALDCVHQAGVVHRDVKPSNIMIDKRREPLLMDFGLARQSEDAALITSSGSIVGTPAYMSPEQVDGITVDARNDIYGLGVLYYHLLTGQLPYTGSLTEVLVKIVQAEPRKPRCIQPNLDVTGEAICLKAMAKEPAERYQSAAELAETLHDYLESPIEIKGVKRPLSKQILIASVTIVLVLFGVIFLKTGNGTLELKFAEEDAVVTLDGKVIEIKTPHDKITIEVGRHKLKVEKDGFKTHTEEFSLWRGGRKVIDVKFKPTASPGKSESISFVDLFERDSVTLYRRVGIFSGDTEDVLKMEWVKPFEKARIHRKEEAWFCRKGVEAADGKVSVKIKIEALGSLDANNNGHRINIGLRVNPDDRVGVWAGLVTFGGEKYAIIYDGTVQNRNKFAYEEGATYRLKLALSGPRATLYIDDDKIVTTDEITLKSSGTSGLWIAGPASWGDAISILVDDWRLE